MTLFIDAISRFHRRNDRKIITGLILERDLSIQRRDHVAVERGHATSTPVHGHALARDVGADKYMECSALTQENVTEVFEEAVRMALWPKDKQGGSSGGGGFCSRHCAIL